MKIDALARGAGFRRAHGMWDVDVYKRQVQNKLHYAVTHHTAAEIVYGRADSTKPVSYTHLDVYKRQGKRSIPQGRAQEMLCV